MESSIVMPDEDHEISLIDKEVIIDSKERVKVNTPSKYVNPLGPLSHHHLQVFLNEA